MGKMILITGGARSGKSAFAERLGKELKTDLLYVATALPIDAEMQERIAKHRKQRPANWDTWEGYRDLQQVFRMRSRPFGGVLVDCVTVMLCNLMMERGGEAPDAWEEAQWEALEKEAIAELASFLDAADKREVTVIMVTNEIGFGIVPESRMARFFRDTAGRVNQFLASRATEVHLVVCGIPLRLK